MFPERREWCDVRRNSSGAHARAVALRRLRSPPWLSHGTRHGTRGTGDLHASHRDRLGKRRHAASLGAPAPPRRHDVFRRQQARLGWGLSAPALILIAGVTIFPIGYAIAMSVSNVSATGSGFSLSGLTGSNYSIMFHAAQWRYGDWSQAVVLCAGAVNQALYDLEPPELHDEDAKCEGDDSPNENRC